MFSFVQGVSFMKSQKEMAVALKQCIFNPKLVKPKCVWETEVVFNFQNFCLNFSKKNYCLAFLHYQHGVKYAPFLYYSHLLLTVIKSNTLQVHSVENLAFFHYSDLREINFGESKS